MQLQNDERDALGCASAAAGAKVQALGKTDLALFSRDEWELVLGAGIIAYTDRLRALRTIEDVPF